MTGGVTVSDGFKEEFLALPSAGSCSRSAGRDARQDSRRNGGGYRKACYKRLMVRWFKPVVFRACLGPLARLGWKAYMGLLGANPIEVITHSTGDWILIFLLVTLSITPLRKLDRAALA